ncbi:hypothetical protein [Streptomyces sp. A012304]|uniref:hypothetical protein n=1 Tax=Streptomyces sp. A012304 TaxID=375446 RepID=UPI0022327401|nr:hypothetical protein [Streptomyces sp. A012304]GKQ37522.1 hypothetical protein ALMP_40590 [Streptomyces sp. A012304]
MTRDQPLLVLQSKWTSITSFGVDGRGLSHGLALMNLLDGPGHLARDRLNSVTLVSAPGHGFHPGSGVNADFRFTVTADGGVAVDDRCVGFAEAGGRTLTLHGYLIAFDGRGLPHDLVPMSLPEQGGVLPRDRVNELTLVPAATYTLRADREPFTEFRFDVATTGAVSPG